MVQLLDSWKKSKNPWPVFYLGSYVSITLTTEKAYDLKTAEGWTIDHCTVGVEWVFYHTFCVFALT